jgi:hypothetical protein
MPCGSPSEAQNKQPETWATFLRTSSFSAGSSTPEKRIVSSSAFQDFAISGRIDMILRNSLP